MFKLVLLFLGVFFGFAQKLPNIDYLSFGYNIFRGNPHPTREGGDPGFVIQRIFDLTYNEHRKTQDGRYEIPDRTDVGHGESCELSFGSTGISGSQKYMHSLEQEVSISVSGFGAKFKASFDYKKVEERTSSYKKLFTFSKAVCEVYAARINTPLSPKLSANFLEAVKSLPETFNLDSYTSFIEHFGTHFVREVRMGARFGCQTVLTQESWATMESMGIRVETAASYSGFGITGAVDTRTEDQKKMARTFDEKKEETNLSTIGARPVKGGDLNAWISQVYKDPMPLRYSLVSISDIFQESYFRDHKPKQNLATLRKNMDIALSGYCNTLLKRGELKSCSAPGPDPPFPTRPVSCRFCANKCGGQFPMDNGVIAADNHKGWEKWSFNYGPGCTSTYGHYDIRDGGVRLCCQKEDDRHKGSCKICASCGGEYPNKVGAEQVDQPKWTKFTLAYDHDCRGDMRNREFPNGGFPFCCKSSPICSLCSSCGGAWKEETGVIGADQNWSKFFLGRGQKCEGPVQTNDARWGMKLCCINNI